MPNGIRPGWDHGEGGVGVPPLPKRRRSFGWVGPTTPFNLKYQNRENSMCVADSAAVLEIAIRRARPVACQVACQVARQVARQAGHQVDTNAANLCR